MTKKQKKQFYKIVAAFVLLIVGVILPIPELYKLIFFIPGYLIVGYDVLVKAGKNITKGQVFDENFLMAIATIGAFALQDLDTIQKGEFSDVTEDIIYLLQVCRHKMENNDYDEFENELRKANDLNGQLSHLKREELQRIQSQAGSIKVSMVYLTMIQEAQNVVTYTINLMKVSRKFQLTE